MTRADSGHRRRVILAALAAAAVLAASAYAFRGRLADAPVIGRLVSPADPAADVESANARPQAVAEPRDAPDARAGVALNVRRQQLVGVRTAPAEVRPLSRTIRTVGIVQYDETRLTDINVKVDGWIRDLYVDRTGQLVEEGDPLFTLYSPELLATQQEYLLALGLQDRMVHSEQPEAHAHAERLIETTRRRLELWDVAAEDLRALEETREPLTAATFRSPARGHVIEKTAVQGMHVQPGQTLYRIADLSRVWVEADVYEQDMGVVRPGLTARVSLDAYPGEQFPGTITFVYPYVEPNTRTVKIRLELSNARGRLRPGMYATVELTASTGRGLTIPSDALVDAGSRQIVFVAEGDGYFAPRDVTVGQRLDEHIQILTGLEHGEQVAMAGTFFVDSESQLRAAAGAFEAPPPSPEAGPAGGSPAGALDLTLETTPDPPRTGDNTFEVTVRDAAGRPIDDASVSAVLFMPAMPSMNMPAMRSEVALRPAGGGRYRGAGQVMMAGRWEVTVTVSRGGARLGSEQFAIVAR